jgi:hypothetical protein
MSTSSEREGRLLSLSRKLGHELDEDFYLVSLALYFIKMVFRKDRTTLEIMLECVKCWQPI